MGTSSSASILGVLPLIAAGFIFNAIFYVTRFRLTKADGQRLFFACVISGFAIGFVAFIIRALAKEWLSHFERLHDALDWLHAAIPVPFGLTFLLAILLACVLGFVGNGLLVLYKFVVDRKDRRRLSVWVYWKCMAEHVTALDQLLRRAVFANELVLLCLKSRKVYCGAIFDITGKQESAIAHVQLIPIFSITRDKDLLKFVPSTRTDYRAYGLKLAFDRSSTLRRLIRSFLQLYKTISNSKRDADRLSRPVAVRMARWTHTHVIAIAGALLRSLGVGNSGRDGVDVRVALKAHIKGLLAEQKQLRQVLRPYVVNGEFDVSVWAKVIPVTEIESASLYRDDDKFTKWFTTGDGLNEPVDTAS